MFGDSPVRCIPATLRSNTLSKLAASIPNAAPFGVFCSSPPAAILVEPRRCPWCLISADSRKMAPAYTTSPSVRLLLRRLSRRVAVGVFLEIWPPWAATSLVAAGLAALICRLLFPSIGGILPWLWLAPILTTAPVLMIWRRRRRRPAEIHALADSLCGGNGALLAVLETGNTTWEHAAPFPASNLVLPRFSLWRKLVPVTAAAAFFCA